MIAQATSALGRRTAMVAPVLLAATLFALAACGGKTSQTDNVADDMTLGSDKAPVTVIEYASLTCPHCAKFNNESFEKFKAKYIDTGKVHYIFREFPLGGEFHAGDGPGFLLARCAGKGNYFKVTDAVWRANDEYARTGDIRTILLRAGASVGLNEQQAINCMSDASTMKTLNDRVERETKEFGGIDGTPTFIINGKKFEPPVGQEPDLTTLDAALQPLLAKKT
jgi:protein-disulfide isomerase